MIEGNTAIDNRGKVTFINDFDMSDVKRFYMVENHQEGFIRAWHGHKKEAKYVFVPTGAALIMVKDMETGEKEEYYMSSRKPQVLYIPPGKYNGSMSLKENTKIMYFSTSTLEESKADDYREEI